MTRGRYLPYGRQLIEDDDIAAVVEVLSGDWLTTGPQVAAFEEALRARVGVRHAVSCSSGTAALHMASLAADLKPEDSVVVPAVTFAATANAPRLTGAEVIFADVDADSGLMRPQDLESAIESASRQRRTAKAAFPVHLNGQCCDMPALSELAEKNGLSLIEDACHALGSTQSYPDNRKYDTGSCRHSDMAVFSFHPVKSIAMGEGGAITTNDMDLDRSLRRLRDHGIVRDEASFMATDMSLDDEGQTHPWYYEVQQPGYNYRASDIHCALGLSQLGKLNRFARRRKELAERYDRLLAPLAPAIRPVTKVPHCDPVLHLYAVLVDFEGIGRSRDSVVKALKAQSIGTQVHYVPLHRQPYYRNRYGELSLPGAEAYYKRTLSLPLFVAMADEDVDFVVSKLQGILGL